MINREYLMIDSITISYTINWLSSKKTPVLFIHGLGSASSDFADAFKRPELADRILIAPDLIGCGNSEKPESFTYDLRSQAAMLDSLLTRLDFSQIDLVAHSMGGVVGILLANYYPKRISRLIVAEPNLVPENARISQSICGYETEENFKRNFNFFINKFKKPENPSSLRFYNTLSGTTPVALFRSACSLLDYANRDLYQKFLNLKVPRHYLKGANSWQEDGDAMLEDFTRAGIGYHVIPDAGHGMMGDNPQAFYQVLLSILSQPGEALSSA